MFPEIQNGIQIYIFKYAKLSNLLTGLPEFQNDGFLK